jgi:hypothetical protein
MYKKSFWAKKPPLELAAEKILWTRRERGKDAQGDLLLRAAVKALRSKDVRSAQRNLKDFLLLTQDLSPFHRSLIENTSSFSKGPVIGVMLATRILQFVPFLIDLLFRLLSKKSQGCKIVQDYSLI